MQILDGKSLSLQERERIAKETAELDFQIGLTVILVGEDAASRIYVSSKEKAAAKSGFKSDIIRLSKTTTEKELIGIIQNLNRDASVHGILVQLPVPKHINENAVIETIDPMKDVDCFHPYNFGRLFAGSPIVEPCTPKGMMCLLDHYKLNVQGKQALVIGRSNIVGKPIAMMLMQRNATVTIAHSRTQNLENLIAQADVLVTAIGKPEFIRGNMIKKGAIVLDVGINRVTDPSQERGYRVTGDVLYEEASERASAITPVPGGVGPMTIAMLMQNTLILARLSRAKA